MKKQIFLVIFGLIGSSIALAQTSSPSSTASMKKAVPRSERAVQYNADAKVTFGTILWSGGLSDGYRSNFTTLTPALGLESQSGFGAKASLPITWITEQSPGAGVRHVGRPALEAQQILVKDTHQLFQVDGGIKLPMYDTSYGGAEYFRAWQFSAGVSGKGRLSDSQYHLFGGANLAKDTNTSMNWGSGVSNSFEFAPALRLRAGVVRETDKFLLGAGLKTINGLGNGKSIWRSDSGSFDSFEERSDIQPADLMAAEIFSEIYASEDSTIQLSLSKSIKNTEAKVGDNYLATFDSLSELAALAITLGFNQKF